MNIPATVTVVGLAWLLTGYASAEWTESDEDRQGLVAARQSAKALLEPVGEAFGCEFTRLRLTRRPGRDGYLAYAGCTGERCAEALDVLNYRGESQSLRFALEKLPVEAEDPDWEPRLGQFDLINEINPEM